MKIQRIILNGCSGAMMVCSLFAADAEAAGPTRLRAPRSYPLAITRPGAYVLTENLTVADPNTHAIEITARDVTLDLGGFVVAGPVTCDGNPTTCSPSGSGYGVVVGGGGTNTTVRNGTVRGFGGDGVHILQGVAENVRALGNGNHGIYGTACVIRDCIANQNGQVGIYGQYCSIKDSVAVSNGDDGIHADGSIVGNVSVGNGGDGISSQSTASGAAAIHENAAIGNGRSGVAGTFTTALGNVAYGNNDFGLTGGDAFGYGLNAASSNVLGQASGGYELAGNVCGLDITCP